MRIIATNLSVIAKEHSLSIIAFKYDRKNYRRYHKTKGLFNKKSMRILKRRKKSGKKSLLQKFCSGKVDKRCILRAVKSSNPKLKKSANFVQTLHRIGGRKVASKDKHNRVKRQKNDKKYARKNKMFLNRLSKAR